MGNENIIMPIFIQNIPIIENINGYRNTILSELHQISKVINCIG